VIEKRATATFLNPAPVLRSSETRRHFGYVVVTDSHSVRSRNAATCYTCSARTTSASYSVLTRALAKPDFFCFSPAVRVTTVEIRPKLGCRPTTVVERTYILPSYTERSHTHTLCARPYGCTVEERTFRRVCIHTVYI